VVGRGVGGAGAGLKGAVFRCDKVGG
jgi:hypothetical protein